MAFDTTLDALEELLDGVLPGPDGIVAVEAIGRLVDATRVRVVSAMDAATAESLGFRSPVDAVATLAGVSEKTARARLMVAEVTRADRTLTGAEVPPRLPVLAAALPVVGMDAAELIARELEAVQAHVEPTVLAEAELAMVNLASGFDPTGAEVVVPVSTTLLSAQFSHLVAIIDPDGARPREERARRRRSFRVGLQDQDGLVPVSGRLMPEIGGLLLGMIEAHRRSPRFTEEPALAHLESSDTRTPDQRRHDAVADVIIAAVRSADAPSLDGMPVHVVVTTTLADLEDENGRAGDPIGTMTGSSKPVSRAIVERLIDSSGFRVFRLAPDGSAAGLSTPQRCFTPLHRLMIAARDGYHCSVPGCTAPHYTLQVHHVVAWRERGPTHVDNGILLCYWHHQTIDTGPWKFRMVNGRPQVRGPGIPDWVGAGAPPPAAAA
jgi:hypothetical protein